jgi:hypothetical protein
MSDERPIEVNNAEVPTQERLPHLEWIHAGFDRARLHGTKSGRPIGRKPVPPGIKDAIRAALAAGVGIRPAARQWGVGLGTVQRLKAEMEKAE